MSISEPQDDAQVEPSDNDDDDVVDLSHPVTASAFERVRDEVFGSSDAYTDEPETNVTDLLADLMHYCAAYGFDFDSMVDSAHRHFSEERPAAQVAA